MYIVLQNVYCTKECILYYRMQGCRNDFLLGGAKIIALFEMEVSLHAMVYCTILWSGFMIVPKLQQLYTSHARQLSFLPNSFFNNHYILRIKFIILTMKYELY